MKVTWILVVSILLMSMFPLMLVMAVGEVQTRKTTTYVDSSGSYHIVGEVINSGESWQKSVVAAVLKDQNGVAIDTIQTPVAVAVAPHAHACYDAVEYDGSKAANVHSYDLSVNTFNVQSLPMRLELRRANVTKDVFGWLNITGQLSNGANATSQFTKVLGTFYNADGNVIFCELTYAGTVLPNSNQLFHLNVASGKISESIVAFSLMAQGQEFSSSGLDVNLSPELMSQPPALTEVTVISGYTPSQTQSFPNDLITSTVADPALLTRIILSVAAIGVLGLIISSRRRRKLTGIPTGVGSVCVNCGTSIRSEDDYCQACGQVIRKKG